MGYEVWGLRGAGSGVFDHRAPGAASKGVTSLQTLPFDRIGLLEYR